MRISSHAIVFAESRKQRDKALKMKIFGNTRVPCFQMKDKPSKKGVLRGAPLIGLLFRGGGS